jgi:hypothetical protein
VSLSPLDAASEGDRVWFEEHPDASSYLRPRCPGEFIPEMEDKVPPGDFPWVEVVLIRRGVRARLVRTADEVPSMS